MVEITRAGLVIDMNNVEHSSSDWPDFRGDRY